VFHRSRRWSSPENASSAPCPHELATTINLQNMTLRKKSTHITNKNIILASNTITTTAPSSKKKMKALINFVEENKKSPTPSSKII